MQISSKSPVATRRHTYPRVIRQREGEWDPNVMLLLVVIVATENHLGLGILINEGSSCHVMYVNISTKLGYEFRTSYHMKIK